MISELAATALKEFCYFLIEYLKAKQTEQGTDGQTDRMTVRRMLKRYKINTI